MKRKINWWNLGVILSILTSLVLLALTPKFVELATITRGYRAYGGECLVWLFPLTYLAIWEGKREYER